MRFIDTHTHIYDPVYDTDREDMISRSVACGVDTLLLADVDSRTRPAMLNVAHQFPDTCRAMVGIHPTAVNELHDTWREELKLVEAELSRPEHNYIAVGEIGMDLYWSKEFVEEQRCAFVTQLELALDHSLPVAIHVRDAWGVTLDILSAYRGRGLRGVVHAYSGSVETYNRLKGLGDFLVGIGGVVTFKNASLGDVVKHIPLSDILLETDSPYLSPTPHRGRRNEPSYIPLIAQHIATLKGCSLDELATATTRNAKRIFGLK